MSVDWISLFTSIDIPFLEKIVRTIVVYLGIALLIRVAGKRLMAQMNSLDLVVVLLLSNVVQNAIIGPTTRWWVGCSERWCWWGSTPPSSASPTPQSAYGPGFRADRPM